jgi:hypothetical protein
LRAWWLHGDRTVDEIPIQLWDTHNHAGPIDAEC